MTFREMLIVTAFCMALCFSAIGIKPSTWSGWALTIALPFAWAYIAYVVGKPLDDWINIFQGCPKSACPACGHYTGRPVDTIHPGCGGMLRALTDEEIARWPNLPDDARTMTHQTVAHTRTESTMTTNRPRHSERGSISIIEMEVSGAIIGLLAAVFLANTFHLVRASLVLAYTVLPAIGFVIALIVRTHWRPKPKAS